MNPGIIIAVFFGFSVLLAILLERQQAQKCDLQLRRLAEQFGFALDESAQSLNWFRRSLKTVAGRYRNREVVFFIYRTQINDAIYSWSAIGTNLELKEPRELGLYPRDKTFFANWQQHIYDRPQTAALASEMKALHEQGSRFSMKAKWHGWGPRKIELADDTFNAAYVLKADDEEFVRALITPKLRNRLLDESAPDRQFQITLCHGQLHLSQRGSLTKSQEADQLAARLDLFCELAAAIEAYVPQNRRVPMA